MAEWRASRPIWKLSDVGLGLASNESRSLHHLVLTCACMQSLARRKSLSTCIIACKRAGFGYLSGFITITARVPNTLAYAPSILLLAPSDPTNSSKFNLSHTYSNASVDFRSLNSHHKITRDSMENVNTAHFSHLQETMYNSHPINISISVY